MYAPTPLQILRGERPVSDCPTAGAGGTSCGPFSVGVWVSAAVAILAGIGGFITACTPLLLGIAKLRFGDIEATTPGMSGAAQPSEKATGTGSLFDAKPGYVIAAVVLGGLFFAYLLLVFAIALLFFIIAFMLTSGILLLAMAYSYKVVSDTQVRRELHGLKIARLRTKPQEVAPPRKRPGLKF